MRFAATRIWGATLLASFTASCTGGPGNGEDFIISVARPPQRVMASFSDIAMDNTFAADFPGLKVDFSRPTNDEVLYEVPNSPRGYTAIRLRFAAAADNATVIHVSADLPASRNTINGSERVSEANLEDFLKIVHEAAAKKLADGKSVQGEREALAKLLVQLALTADDVKLARALDMARSPELYGLSLGSNVDQGAHGFSGGDSAGLSEAYDSYAASTPIDAAQGDDARPEKD